MDFFWGHASFILSCESTSSPKSLSSPPCLLHSSPATTCFARALNDGQYQYSGLGSSHHLVVFSSIDFFVQRADLDDTYYISFSPEISAFYQLQLGLNIIEYAPQLAGEIIVRPAQNRRYSSCARRTHPCDGPTVIGMTRRHVSVPWGVKSITNSSLYYAQRDKVSAIALTELSRSATSVRSPCEPGHESPENCCAFCVWL